MGQRQRRQTKGGSGKGRGRKSVNQTDPSLIAAKALKKKEGTLRVGVDGESIRKICPVGWTYSEELSEQLTSDAGYYQDAEQSRAGYLLDPDDAYDLFVHHNYESNRKFDQAHSANLAHNMAVAVAIDIAIGPSGFPVVVNGQHTLWAIYMRGRPTQISVTVYQCRDKAAVAAVFALFDSNKKRTLANTIDAAVAGGLKLNVSSRHHQRWTQAVAAAENNFNAPRSRATNAEKMERATRLEVVAFSEWIDGLIENAQQAKMVQQGIAAAFYAMFASDLDNATKFVKRYLSVVREDINDPVGRLRDRMTINKPQAEHGSSACSMHAGMAYTAWRAFCLGKTMKQVRQTKDIPAPDKWKIFTPASSVVSMDAASVVNVNSEVGVAAKA